MVLILLDCQLIFKIVVWSEDGNTQLLKRCVLCLTLSHDGGSSNTNKWSSESSYQLSVLQRRQEYCAVQSWLVIYLSIVWRGLEQNRSYVPAVL